MLDSDTGGPRWRQTWNLSTEACQRYGIRCRGNAVVGIELAGNNLEVLDLLALLAHKHKY
jgi:hypothetical protein